MALFGYTPTVENTLVVALEGFASTNGFWPPQQSTTTGAFWVDFSAVVASRGNDLLTQVSVSVGSDQPTPPTVVNAGTDGTFCCLVISGGTPPDNPVFALHVTFASGFTQTYDATLPLVISPVTGALQINGGGLSTLAFGPATVDITALSVQSGFASGDSVMILKAPAGAGQPYRVDLATIGLGPGQLPSGADVQLAANGTVITWATHDSVANGGAYTQSLTLSTALNPVGIALPLSYFENNSAYSTAGYFLSAASAGNSGSVYPSKVVNAALAASAAYPGVLRIIAPDCMITGFTDNLLIQVGHTVVHGGPSTYWEFVQTVGSDGTAGDGCISDANGGLGPFGSYEFVNIRVGFRATAFNSQTGAQFAPGQPVTWRAQNGGDWTGLTVGAVVPTDPLNPLTQGNNFFYVPASAFANLAAAQAAMPVGWFPNQPYYFPYNFGLAVASVTQYAGTLNGSVNPYLVTLVATQSGTGTSGPYINYTAGFACVVQAASTSSNQVQLDAEDAYYVEKGATVTFSGAPAGLTVTKVVGNVAYLSASVSLAYLQSIVFGTGTLVTFTNAAPAFYSGSGFNLAGSDSYLEKTSVFGVSHGRQYTMGGLRNRAKNISGFNNVSTSGAGGFFRFSGGWFIDGLVGCSGDEYLACEGGGGGTLTVVNFDIVSSGPPISIDQSVSNPKQSSVYPCSTSQATAIGNVLLMDLASFPLDNPAWSTSNTLAAAQAFQAQVASYAAGNAAAIVTLLCKGAGGGSPYPVGALLNSTSKSFYPGLIYAGATASSVAINGNSVAITLAAIPGQAHPISTAIAAASGWTVTMGYSYTPWVASSSGTYLNGTARCLNDSCTNILNKDSSGSVSVRMENVYLDMRYCQSNTGKFGCQIGSTSSSGGLNLWMKNVRFRGAFANPYEIFGSNTEVVAEDVDFGAPSLAGTTCTTFGGINRGWFSRCIFRGNGADVAVFGNSDLIDSINCIKRGSNGMVGRVVLEDGAYYTPDGHWAINAQWGRYEVRRGVVIPLNPSVTGNTANGVYTGSAAINQSITINGLDCSAIGTGGIGVNSTQLNTGYGCYGSTVDLTCAPPAGQTITPLLHLVASHISQVMAGPINIFSIVPIGGTAQLWPQVSPQKVRNNGLNPLLIQPPTGGQINGLAVNATYSVPINTTVEFDPSSLTVWSTM
jgi:hypothetical protein